MKELLKVSITQKEDGDIAVDYKSECTDIAQIFGVLRALNFVEHKLWELVKPKEDKKAKQ